MAICKQSNSFCTPYDMRIVLAFFGVLIATLAFYLPGLQGPFVFDDIPNLQPLKFFGGVVDLPSALYFIFGNESGPLGRPLSMASFLINDQAWPADPYSFKYTNLLFHLINGCLVFLMLMQVGSVISVDRKKWTWIALVATAVWLLHPFNVSTVLYVVQRMTILSTMAMLLGVITYLHFRVQKEISRATQILMLAIIVVAGSIGLLFKETAVLLVVYISALEFTIFSSRGNWWPFRMILVAGLVLLVSALATKSLVFSDQAWQHRSFSVDERIYTQGRILWDYISHIVLPRTGGTGLMHDDFELSTSIINPWTTLPALVGIIMVAVFGLVKRRSSPTVSLCIFWFLGGHLLESTILPLENYFEHRNYLPMVLVVWGLTYGLIQIPKYLPYKIAFSAGYLMLGGVVLSSTIKVWSSQSLLENIWGLEHPSSPRAQQMLARQAIYDGDMYTASNIIARMVAEEPRNHHLILQSMILHCLRGQQFQISDFKDRIQKGPKNNGVYEGLMTLRQLMSERGCGALTTETMLTLNNLFLDNKNYQGSSTRAFLYKEIATLQVMRNDLDKSIQALDKAYLADSSNIVFPLTQAYWLSDAGLMADALHYLEVARTTMPKHYFQRFQYDKMYEDARTHILGEPLPRKRD